MELSNAFYEAVAEKQVRKIRIMLKDSLLVDPTFERFKKMEKEASSIDGLYDPHDGRAFEEDSEKWNDDYLSLVMAQVIGNFSHERVEHMMKVVRKLRPITEQSSTAHSHRRTTADRNDYQAQKKRDQANGNYREAKIVGGAVACAAVGGAVGAVIASSAAVGAVAGTVVGAAIGAAVTYCSTNERK